MKKTTLFILILFLITFSGCSGESNILERPSDTLLPMISLDEQLDKQLDEQFNIMTSNDSKKVFCFDVSKEQDPDEYKRSSGLDFNYFSAGIFSPYIYSYNCEIDKMTIDEIAHSLGIIMMEDFMKDYEDKTFIITEYQNLTSHVLDDVEVIEWQDTYYNALGQKVILKENQWLCNFDCEFRYTGIYSNIGKMPEDMDWKKGLLTDGSGEDYVFIIQKTNNNEYIMRAMPKAFKEEYQR